MTPTDAIELAIEAGISKGDGRLYLADEARLLAFANLVEARVKERAAKVCEDMPDVVLEFWDRPGSAPGNGYRPHNRKDIASAIRSME